MNNCAVYVEYGRRVERDEISCSHRCFVSHYFIVILLFPTILFHTIHQKQNILAIHIAKVLSQKKHRKKIGAVHISIDSSDLRRVVLILTPPLPDDDVAGKDGTGSGG